MAEPYSLDLRERVVAACDEGVDTREEVAERFGVSVGFVYAMLRLRKSGGGSLEPRPHSGGYASAVDDAARDRIRRLVGERPDATLEELCRDLRKGDGGGGRPKIKKSRMGQVLAAMGLKRKKDARGV